MSTSAIIEKMIEHRALASDEDYEAFESEWDQLVENFSVEDFPQILNVFYDETEDHEFMWGVVHLIEDESYMPEEDYLKCIALYSPDMTDAHEWAMLLNIRILNTQHCYEKYVNIICELDKESQNRMLNLLSDLKEESQEHFGEKVDSIFKAVEQCGR